MLVFIVGTYKSGTSMITEMVENIGVPSVADRVSIVPGVRGNYKNNESSFVNDLNNRIFQYFHQSVIHFSIDNFYDNFPIEFKNEIKNFYESIDYHGAIKDPRFIATLKYWLKCIPNDIDYKIIWVKRNNKDDVIKSFHKDPWFEDKLFGEYSKVVDDLRFNLECSMKEINDGMIIEYGYAANDNQAALVLIYNYLNSITRGIWKYHKVYFSEFYFEPNVLHSILVRQTPFNSGTYENITITNSQNLADTIVIQDKTKENINYYDKTLFLGREPKHVPGGYRIGDEYNMAWHHEYTKDGWLPVLWWLDKDYDSLKKLNYNECRKDKKISIIDSGKANFNGQIKRVSFIEKFINNYSDAAVFGYICNNRNGKMFKGTLPFRNKLNGLLNYKYSLVIENGRTDNYFSEKFTDPILCWTIPIYYGCKQIHKFFPDNSYYTINVDDKNAVEKIIDIINTPVTKDHIAALSEARNLILDKYNIWPTIKHILEND